MLLPLSLLIALSPTSALAAPPKCDLKALNKAMDEAGLRDVADAWIALNACDGKAGAKRFAEALSESFVGEPSERLMLIGIQSGQQAAVASYLAGLSSEDRTQMLKALGDRCGAEAAVMNFFLSTADTHKADFWGQGWFKSLSGCRQPPVQDLLSRQLANRENKSLWLATLQVYARNLGASALPTLGALLDEYAENDEFAAYVIDAFADAAQIGAVEGMDTAVAEQAVALIVERVPKLKPLSIDHARAIVTSLGKEEVANTLAIHRYAASKHPDGRLYYGVIAVEDITCKKGKKQLVIHTGKVGHAGDQWPDQVTPGLAAMVKDGWSYPAASKCKGTASTEVIHSEVPLSPEAMEDWHKAQVSIAQKTTPDVPAVLVKEPDL